MRPAPGPIPATLPDTDKVIRNITYLVDLPRPQLADYSVSDLVNMYAGGPCWLTGSTVWLPAVFDTVEKDTDFDIVLPTAEAAQKFIDGVLAELNRKVPDGYTTLRSRFGSARIAQRPGADLGWLQNVAADKPIMDIWALDGDESIAELLMAYPHDYHRAAFYMSWAAPTAASLTRIIKMHKRRDTNMDAMGMFREIRQAPNVY